MNFFFNICISLVHVVVDNSENHEFYTKNINAIKGASRIWNVSIYLKENYVKNINSIQEELNSNCSLFLSVQVCHSKLIKFYIIR